MQLKKITVSLRPFTVEKRVGNLSFQKSTDQDYVDVRDDESGDVQTWGYSPTIKGHGTFLPLSGFPMEYAPEVQRQINALRGHKEGEGPEPPKMIQNGRTAAEQEAEAIESDDDSEEEEYE